jgi:hypothetical protein
VPPFIKKILIDLLPDALLRFIRDMKYNHFDGYAHRSYSQEGEDMILRRIFENQEKGFYVDVGAHHPKRFSNTYFFYKRGWRGINIDAMPNSMALFEKLRPRDINVEKAISDTGEPMTYYIFDEPALNGFIEALTYQRDGHRDYHIVGKEEMVPSTLKAILDLYLPEGQVIDFLSVDVEGMDLKVLTSNDWIKYRPRVVLVEALESKLNDIFRCELTVFLEGKGYNLYGKGKNTLFFTLANAP